MTESEIIDILKAKGISPTRPRVAILKYIHEHFTHPTVDEVFTDLAPCIPTLSKTTVYNTLRMYAGKGICNMLTIDEKQLVFDGDTRPHAHFMCRSCGKVYDVPFTGKTALRPELPGHKVEDIQLYYKGVCQACLHAK